MKVTLYTKPECHLCDDALAVIERVRAEQPFELSQVDIEDDRALFERYRERVPVVTVDGAEVFDYVVDAEVLRSIVAGGASPSQAGTAPPPARQREHAA